VSAQTKKSGWGIILGLLIFLLLVLFSIEIYWQYLAPELSTDIRVMISTVFTTVGPFIVPAILVVLYLRHRSVKQHPGSTVIPDATTKSLLIPRDESNSYTRALAVRDALFEKIDNAAEKASLPRIGYKSPNQNSTGAIWFRFECLPPPPVGDKHMSLRSAIEVTINRHDFHRFECLLDVKLQFAGHEHSTAHVIDLNPDEILRIIDFLSGKRKKPPHLRQIRLSPLHFWKTANKIVGIRSNYLVIALGVLSVVFLAVPAGFIVSIGIWVGLAIAAKRRKTYVLSAGKPKMDPRNLLRLDSWQANIEGLGSKSADVKAAIIDRLRENAGQDVKIESEAIWYPGVDGKVEREQLVTAFRRAIAFVHVQPYGDDLYVGWDSHVNAGTWMEERVASGISRSTRLPVVANRVIAAWQAPNEYDLTDANFLTEWVHSHVVRIVRLKLEEHKIDQEIDFTINRESRRDLLEEEDRGDRGTKKAGRKRLERVG